MIYRVTFSNNENTFFSTAAGANEFVEVDENGFEVWDIETDMPDVLERDLNTCPDVVSYRELV